MKIVKEIEELAVRCRAGETDLAKLRQNRDEVQAKYASAESLAVASPTTADAINTVAAKLAEGRRDLEDLSCQIGLHEQNLTHLQALLRNRAVALLGEARDHYGAFRDKVKAELQARIAPFLPPQNFRRAIPESSLVPLEKARSLVLGIEGQLEQLKTDPVTASLLFVGKYQALVEECAAVGRALGI
jgi:DNA repair exonuclease SbcCD ATPase subunit